MQPISKRNLKRDKILRKSNAFRSQALEQSDQLHNGNTITGQDPNFVLQYIDPSNQYLIQLFRLIKARQWWQNLDATFFKPLKLKNILFARDLTSSQKLINFFTTQDELASSFQNEEIFSKCPHLAQNALIHVLFKSSTPFVIELVSFSFVNYIQNINKRSLKIPKEQNTEFESIEEYKISSFLKRRQDSQILIDYSQEELQQTLKTGNLQFELSFHEDQLISKIQRAQQTQFKMAHEQCIEVQLKLWQQEADIKNSQNSILWNNLLSNYQKSIETQSENFKAEVFSIKQQLMHHTLLRYMQHGTRDKTPQMLKQLLDNMKQIKPAKTRESTIKKFFETDCKICFCSFNYDSNQVLYCDMCNTSFHLACYGLYEVPQQKQYFCDRCTAIKKEDKIKSNSRKIICQICCKPNFPIKNIDGHFYHMTCLILFNYITIKEGRIQLRQGLNHQTIIKTVIQAQLECQSCIFCPAGPGADMGMQFKCCFEGCQSSMHPICAYINGCEFNIRKNMKNKKIEVSILCNKHDCERDYIQQTYLRRYMCNFKNTSQKPLQSFRTEYDAEISARTPKLNEKTNPNSQLPSLIIDTKVIKKHISFRDQKKNEKNLEITSTETRKIFQKLVKNQI